MAKVRITETVLRDAHQSLIATRMTTDEMLPILDTLDKVGYYSLEAWGGATFDACMRFLNEDPWERLRKIRHSVKNTKLQMLLRGQNLLGYKHYADDVVEYFIQKAVSNGIDIIRIFDALNDVRNLETSIKACKKEGGHAQGTVCYTISPVHTLDHFVKDARLLAEMGADSICIKDMAGLLLPFEAYNLVSAMKKVISIPIQVHTHYTSGVASMTYLKSIEAGAEMVDCAISPMSMGTSQPPTESIVATLQGTLYDTGLDLSVLSQIADYFKPLKDSYISRGLYDTKISGVDVNALIYQVPGGMLSNLISQLKQSNAVDKFDDVLKEIPKVREEMGYPPLVTPTSQIVGTQAVLNVVTGERYKMVPKETKGIVRGEYGKTPAPISEAIRKLVIGDETPIETRPADLIAPELEAIRAKVSQIIQQEEDILSYALLPQVAETFFLQRTQNNSKKQAEIDDTNQQLNNEEVTAVISAAIASIESQEGSQLIVRSIQRTQTSISAWGSPLRMYRNI